MSLYILERDAVLLGDRDFVYVRTDPAPIGGQARNPRQLKTSDLAVTRAHLKAVRENGFRVHRRDAVTERIGAAVASSGRPKFMKLLRRLDSTTGLLVWSLDGLGRDAADILATIRRVRERGAEVYCLAVSDDELSQCGDLMNMLEALATLMRKTAAERAGAKGVGRGVAGGRFGRPPSLDDTAQAEVRVGLSAGETVSALARRYDTSRQTILRIRDAQN